MVHINVELSTGDLDGLVVLSENMKAIDNTLNTNFSIAYQ